MDSTQTLMLLSKVTNEERLFLGSILDKYSEEDKKKFIIIYVAQRKDPQHILLFTLLGFAGVAGIQRFALDNIVLGIIYFFTAGFCGIGTFIDAIRYKELTFEYNRKIANIISNSI